MAGSLAEWTIMTKRQSSKWATASPSRYPRTARVNEVLREVVASALERISGDDDRLELVTVTGIECEPDLRHATVFFSALGTSASAEEVATALDESRIALQAAVAKEVRLKRTPQLRFVADAGVTEGQKVEQILSGLHIDDTVSGDPRPSDDSRPTDSRPTESQPTESRPTDSRPTES
jgi:ribosome-binding factor A